MSEWLAILRTYTNRRFEATSKGRLLLLMMTQAEDDEWYDVYRKGIYQDTWDTNLFGRVL